MTRKLKVRKSSASASSETSNPISEPVEEVLQMQDEGVVEEEIEEHSAPASSLIDKARGILRNGIDNTQEKLGGESQKRERKKWVPPEKRKEQESNITTLVTSLLIMLVAGWKVPEDLKPNNDEMTAISGFSTSILLRHVNLSGRLTADVIDVIGIVAVTAGYVTRTSQGWSAHREQMKVVEPPAPLPVETSERNNDNVNLQPSFAPAL